jgi:hypothetical protein
MSATTAKRRVRLLDLYEGNISGNPELPFVSGSSSPGGSTDPHGVKADAEKSLGFDAGD